MVIIEKEYIKDLGVYISSDLTWTRQINEVVSGARTMSGWGLRGPLTFLRFWVKKVHISELYHLWQKSSKIIKNK